jgi:hypothetical protein
MLRLVNAKSCERGDECYAYNLIKKEPAALGKSPCVPFALSLCLACRQGMSTVCGKWNSWYTKNKQVCTFDSNRLLCNPQIEESTGELVGPLVLYKHVKQLESTFVYRGDHDRTVILEECATRLDVSQNNDKERAEKFISAFDFAKDDYPLYTTRKMNVIRDTRKFQRIKYLVRKLEVAKCIYGKIQDGLEGFKFKDLVMACTWDQSTSEYVCRFDHWPSRYCLGRLLDAPSRSTKKSISEAVALVQRTYTLLETFGLIGDHAKLVLHNMVVQNSLDRGKRIRGYERAIIKYYIDNITPQNFLELQDCYGLDMLRLLQTETGIIGVVKALLIFLRSGQPGVGNNQIDITRRTQQIRDVFVFGVVPSTNNPICAKKRLLAGRVWNRKSRFLEISTACPDNLLNGFRCIFNECKSEYYSLKKLIREYQQQDITKAWLKLAIADPLQPSFTKQVSLFLEFNWMLFSVKRGLLEADNTRLFKKIGCC